jgi:peptide/nickel transport system permease protein
METDRLLVKLKNSQRAKRILRDKGFAIGSMIIIAMFVLALAPAAFAPYSPTEMVVRNRLSAPSTAHLLGTDELGRDILSRIIYGARTSAMVSLGGVTIAVVTGTIIGMIAGLARASVDNAIMRVLDIFLAFPVLLLALAIMASLGAGISSIFVALAVVYTPGFARLARGATLSERENDYILASRMIGVSYWRLVLRHLLPNIASPIMVQFTVRLGYAILLEATLSFLGLGVPPPHPAWGAMLSRGKGFMEVSPWVVLGPGLAIMLTVLGFNLAGDGLRDILDPRLIKR